MADQADDDVPGVPEWVVTYGDMMSLLLTFFIMLVSMSELKQEGSLRAMLDAIREAFGSSVGRNSAPGESLQSTSVLNKLKSTGRISEGGVKKAGRKSKGAAGPHRTVRRISHGSVATLGGAAVFEPFDATLTEVLQQTLDDIARVLRDKPNRIMVRGHAAPNPLPDDSSFRDVWDLSFARANAAAQYLVEQGIERRRVLVSAAGDTEPRHLTRQKEGQRFNRRVDVFLIDAYITHPASSRFD